MQTAPVTHGTFCWGDGSSSYGKINLPVPEEGKWSVALLTPAAAARVQLGMGGALTAPGSAFPCASGCCNPPALSSLPVHYVSQYFVPWFPLSLLSGVSTSPFSSLNSPEKHKYEKSALSPSSEDLLPLLCYTISALPLLLSSFS